MRKATGRQNGTKWAWTRGMNAGLRTWSVVALACLGMARMTLGQELLTNTGFEVNTTGWSANGCSIQRYTAQFNSGSASCRAYSRNPASDGLLRNITTLLQSNGPGYYTFSAYMRIASGSATGRIQVETNSVWTDITGPITSTGWTKVSASLYLTWGALSSAMFAINTTDSLADLYIDDCSLQKTAVATPLMSPDGGVHIDSVEVTITCSTPDSAIYYTTNNTTPTTSSTLYSAPFTLTESATVKAVATKSGMQNSAVASADFTVTAASQVVAPTLTPNGGTHIDRVDVSLASLTDGASLSYTLDGTTPTTNSLLYSAPFTLTSNTTVKAFAWKADMTDSAVISADFIVKLATPTISPNGGAFVGSVDVTLACSSPGATIFYTTNGIDPTTSSLVYNNTPFTLSESTTVKALAWRSGITESTIASALFSATVATPVIAPNGGLFTNNVEVTLTCDTPGALIRFTSDNATPGTTSGSYVTYTGPFRMSGGTLKAYGYRSGDANSAMASATFVNATNEPWALIPVPGRVEAENYRVGGEGVGYSDTTSGNSGHLYRADKVDIEFCGDANGGYNIGWTAVGEWLAYTLDVAQNNQYDFVFRIASGSAGEKTISVQLDGVAVGSVSSTRNDGWQAYFDVTLTGVYLTKGTHQMKILLDTAGVNLNYLDLVAWPPRGTMIRIF